MNPSFSRWPYQDTQRSIRIQSHSKNYITVLFTSPNHNMISSFGGEDSCTICREFVVEIWIVYCLNLGLLYLTPTIYIYTHSMASARTFASDHSWIKTWSWLYNHDHRPKPFTTNFYLLGGCNPFEKCYSNGIISPIKGKSSKNGNRHPLDFLFTHPAI